MSTYDEIDFISNADKLDIIDAWSDLISVPMTAEEYRNAEKSVCQLFHVLTGHSATMDDVDWWVHHWRGY